MLLTRGESGYKLQDSMKQLIVLLVAGSLLSIVFFGFLFMTGDLHDMARCFAAALQGRECPEAASPFLLASFHADILKLFSTAVLLLSFLALFWAVFLFQLVFQLPAGLVQRVLKAEIRFWSKKEQMQWIERHLRSPNSFFGRQG